ncbi:hypothetical protein HYC85_009214 [Camellia sinensis]|uniref:DUF4220 domain-containing protein n=1 Tax=Camellia sinensis TaxID=4442 RepID=A0A7J7HEC2_CAMSI|nr:hypothetical protein HYC85_009214 [Camellia sinensis]
MPLSDQATSIPKKYRNGPSSFISNFLANCILRWVTSSSSLPVTTIIHQEKSPTNGRLHRIDEPALLCYNRRTRNNNAAHNTFKLIEIELGLMYDMLFSKYGSILRLICISCIVTVLVGFFLVKKPDGHFKGDLPITIILLVGAICLEISGALVQLGSDWAIFWACKHYPSKLVTPVFHLHKFVISKNKDGLRLWDNLG